MSERRRYSNTAVPTTLTGPLSGSGTSCTVAGASGYPNPPFAIRIGDEVILVRAKTGTTFSSLDRGYDGTVAVPHATSAAVTHVAIADDFSTRWLDVIVEADSVSGYDDEFDDGDMSSWVQTTVSGTASWRESHGVMSCRFKGVGGNQSAVLLHSLDGLSYPIYLTAALRGPIGLQENYWMAGICYTQGTLVNANAIATTLWTNGTQRYFATRGLVLNNMSTNHHGDDAVWASGGGWTHIRLDWIATGLWAAWLSPDGVSWTQCANTNITSASVTPSHYGLWVSNWNSGNTSQMVATWDYFRSYTTKPTYWQD